MLLMLLSIARVPVQARSKAQRSGTLPILRCGRAHSLAGPHGPHRGAPVDQVGTLNAQLWQSMSSAGVPQNTLTSVLRCAVSVY